MLVIVASPHDRAAAALAARWSRERARVLSPRDLSRPGWRHHVGTDGDEWAVIDGACVRTSEIRGVVTRLPGVREQDLSHIVPEDREYVAAEMHALLLSWLTRLRCPVVNRPTATSLMGRNLSVERWLVLAARAGLPLARRSATAERPRVVGVVTVVGGQAIGDVAPELAETAIRLARSAEVTLCTVRFDGAGPGAGLIDADLFVELGDRRIADALRDHLAREAAA